MRFGNAVALSEVVTDMLKISTIESPTKCLLVLEGKLLPPWTEELLNICRERQLRANHGELVIDIRGVTIISREGEDVLLSLILEGAKFRGIDVFTRQILKQLAKRAQKVGDHRKVPES